ncbi:MAG: Endo,4-beta-glucanase [Fibrobacteres bacterium]|nr:Endo,4-beta-glucanase [Fibrobacterota bacterium]
MPFTFRSILSGLRIPSNLFPSALLASALACASSAPAQDWGSLQNLLIRFYGFQRAGDKAFDSHNPFYKTSPYPHSQDNHQGKDLSGGWYDAGDFVKFGLPLGYSVYTLLKGYDVFPNAYDDLDSWDYKGAKDNIPDVLGEAKLATDYLIKAVISEGVVVTDVGNGAQDHQQLNESGYANSQRTSPRSATVGTGADVAGLYAASLALMAKLYKPYDSAYAAICLAKAKDAFKFGLLNQKLSVQQGNASYYSTKTFADKMACGAIELYRATGSVEYLTHAQAFQAKVASHFFVLGYANVGDLSAFELARLGYDTYQAVWMTDVDLSLSRVVTAASAPELIKGAFIRSDWGNAGHAAAAAFSAALAFQLTGANAYRDFAINQMKWVAGIAPFKQSYIVGYLNGPTAPHHRNDVSMSNVARLKGGIVSGPTPTGTFNDTKPEASGWSFDGNNSANYKNTEVALDYNAAAVGAAAFIRDYLNPPAGVVRIVTGVKATPDNVDFNTQTTTITFELETASAWKLALSGRVSKAKKSFTGTGTAGAAKWSGEADEGAFTAGETVDLILESPVIASYHLSRAKGNLYITAVKKEAFRAEDIVLDDFEDADSLNAFKGPWSVFTDKAAKGTSYANPAGFGPAMFASGEAGSKCISVRLVGAAGAPKPVAGIRTVFNPAGTAVGLGPAKSVVFDVKSSAGGTFRVELEQSDIADMAFHGFQATVGNDLWNRIRIPFTAFSQPAWKTQAKGFNPNSVTALRFAYYGEGTVRLDLDNIRMEGMKIGPAGIKAFAGPGRSKTVEGLRISPASLEYRFRPGIPGASWRAEVLDLEGRVRYAKDLGKVAMGSPVSLTGCRLERGRYFLRHIAESGRAEIPFSLLVL